MSTNLSETTWEQARELLAQKRRVTITLVT